MDFLAVLIFLVWVILTPLVFAMMFSMYAERFTWSRLKIKLLNQFKEADVYEDIFYLFRQYEFKMTLKEGAFHPTLEFIFKRTGNFERYLILSFKYRFDFDFKIIRNDSGSLNLELETLVSNDMPKFDMDNFKSDLDLSLSSSEPEKVREYLAGPGRLEALTSLIDDNFEQLAISRKNRNLIIIMSFKFLKNFGLFPLNIDKIMDMLDKLKLLNPYLNK